MLWQLCPPLSSVIAKELMMGHKTRWFVLLTCLHFKPVRRWNMLMQCSATRFGHIVTTARWSCFLDHINCDFSVDWSLCAGCCGEDVQGLWGPAEWKQEQSRRAAETAVWSQRSESTSSHRNQYSTQTHPTLILQIWTPDFRLHEFSFSYILQHSVWMSSPSCLLC